jgi:hypothetical protein
MKRSGIKNDKAVGLDDIAKVKAALDTIKEDRTGTLNSADLATVKFMIRKTGLSNMLDKASAPTVEMLMELIQYRNEAMRFELEDEHDSIVMHASAILDKKVFNKFLKFHSISINPLISDCDFNDIKMIGLIYVSTFGIGSIFNTVDGAHNLSYLNPVHVFEMSMEAESLAKSGAFKSAAFDVFTKMIAGPEVAFEAKHAFDVMMFEFLISIWVNDKESETNPGDVDMSNSED